MRTNEDSGSLEADLNAFLSSSKPKAQKIAELAHKFLIELGEPTDIAHSLVAMKALDDLWDQKRKQGQ